MNTESVKVDKEAIEGQINEAVNHDMSPEEKGALLAEIASADMDMVNSVNERYLNELRQAIKAYEAIDKSQSRMNDKIRIDEVRSSLSEK